MSVLDGWHWCPRCKGALEKARGAALCPACGFVTYANSAPTASALVVDDRSRVLLARRAGDPFRGLWDVPGGFLEEGEHPEDGLRRELHEETGFEIEPTAYLGVWMDQYGDGLGAPATLNLVWTARIVAGEERPDDDVAELAWFGRGELPPRDELAFATVAAVLEAWRQQNP